MRRGQPLLFARFVPRSPAIAAMTPLIVSPWTTVTGFRTSDHSGNRSMYERASMACSLGISTQTESATETTSKKSDRTNNAKIHGATPP